MKRSEVTRHIVHHINSRDYTIQINDIYINMIEYPPFIHNNILYFTEAISIALEDIKEIK